jgi:hypothetical protein
MQALRLLSELPGDGLGRLLMIKAEAPVTFLRLPWMKVAKSVVLRTKESF